MGRDPTEVYEELILTGELSMGRDLTEAHKELILMLFKEGCAEEVQILKQENIPCTDAGLLVARIEARIRKVTRLSLNAISSLIADQYEYLSIDEDQDTQSKEVQNSDKDKI